MTASIGKRQVGKEELFSYIRIQLRSGRANGLLTSLLLGSCIGHGVTSLLPADAGAWSQCVCYVCRRQAKSS